MWTILDFTDASDIFCFVIPARMFLFVRPNEHFPLFYHFKQQNHKTSSFLYKLDNS